MLLFALLVEFTDIMMRKCLLGIKRRAEREERVAREREVGVDRPLVRNGTRSSSNPGVREMTTIITYIPAPANRGSKVNKRL
jgi:hypothetical protein